MGDKYPTGQNKKPEWMKSPPEEGVVSKMWKTKMWHYCHPTTGGKCDGEWRVHRPSECKGSAFNNTFASKMSAKRKAEESQASTQSETPDKKKVKKLKMKRAEAYQATSLGWSDHDDAFLTDTPLSQQDDDGSTDDEE